jgi:hypothetical protein
VSAPVARMIAVREGMSPEQVLKLLGEPTHEIALGPFGSCDWVYQDGEVRFIRSVVSFTSSVGHPEYLRQKPNFTGYCVRLKRLKRD